MAAKLGFAARRRDVASSAFFARSLRGTPVAASPTLSRHPVEGMASSACCFSQSYGRECQAAAQEILLAHHWLKVTWPHTRADATQMVELHSSGDRPHELFIGEAMSANGAPGGYCELSVPLTERSLPKPAGFSLTDESPEPLCCADSLGMVDRIGSRAFALPSAVMEFAQVAVTDQSRATVDRADHGLMVPK